MEAQALDILQRLTSRVQRLTAEVNSIGKYLSERDPDAHFNPGVRDKDVEFSLDAMEKDLNKIQTQIKELRDGK